MTGEIPEKSGKSRERDEMREVRLRETVDETLPVILAIIARELPGYVALGFSKKEFSYDDNSKFLQIPDLPQRVKDQMYKEWQEGDQTLLISFFTLAAARGHLYVQDMERGIAEAEEEGVTLSDEAEMSLNIIRSERAKTESSLVWLLDHSEVFGKRYSADDLRAWVQGEEEFIRRVRKLGARIPERILEVYKVFDRILSGNFQKADRDRLRAILDGSIAETLMLPQINFIEVLRGVHGSREELVKNIKSLLMLYHIRKFVDQTIPVEEP